MLGKILSIEGDIVLLKLGINLGEIQNIINYYVLLEDSEQKLVGEIEDIKDSVASIKLLGRLEGEDFVAGITKKPSFAATSKLISSAKVQSIIGIPNYDDKKDLMLGKSIIYNDVNVGVNINNFFSNHFAIFGSTGSGKSCSIARILQNLFNKKSTLAYNATILLFDAYGEYHSAFSNLNQIAPELSFKNYTTNTKTDEPMLKIPLWLLTVDDIALLLNTTSASQLPIIEKALKLTTVFAKEESQVIKIKNDIIANALLDILESGSAPAQIRDQIFSVLSHYNTKDLNLDTPIYQPGYTRPIKQCFNIDNTGKIREMELLTTFIKSFIIDNVELSLPDGSFKYTLNNLYEAFEFALISEGTLNSSKIYEEYNVLKVRLKNLLNSDYSKYFEVDEYCTKVEFIKKLITVENNKKAQIINFNINYVDDRFAKNIVKIYSKLFFDYAKELEPRASFPVHILLEEAHRYVQNDQDEAVIGYNIFDRIAKEGRKYGVILGLISQRPSELSATALSQCTNFLIFKMLHPLDIEYIEKMVPNITEDTIKKLKLLPPGTCVVFGQAFKITALVKLDMPNPAPTSSSCDVSKIWFIDRQS